MFARESSECWPPPARADTPLPRLDRHREHGQIGEALLEYANHATVDLIALGGHELGLVDRVLLGSIRTKVLRTAECSVLIAPPAPQETDV